jgi:lycopene cyclase domain-containing protein
MAYSYILWLTFFVLAPLCVLWVIYFRTLSKYWDAVLFAVIGALIFSFPWDYISIKEHIWYCKLPYIVGLWVFGLPIEEYLFIILVTLLLASILIVVWSRLRVNK